MALKTDVHIRYRTPYISNIELPSDVEKLMRKEITNMRKDLIKKQEALRRSSKYQEDERLLNQLQDLKVSELKTAKDVQNTWNRLRGLELSNQTSVSGKNLSRQKAIESFNQSGFKQVNNTNYDDFVNFIDRIRNELTALLYDSEELIDIYYEYLDDGSMDGMNADERYNLMVQHIIDELQDKYRTYDTDSKFKQALNKNVEYLNRMNFVKDSSKKTNK